MPKKIHPLLDREKQTLALKYEKTKRLVSLMESLFSLILSVIFILFINRALISHLPQNPILQILVFSWCLIVFYLPLEFILSYISSYRVEHKFGFSNQSFKDFILDFLKDHAIQLILYPILMGALVAVMNLSGSLWWFYAALSMLLFSFVFATLFPIVILPLFNHYTPIEDPEIIRSLSDILTKGGLSISGFFMEDMSRQTKKENAFLAGLGHTRRVVLSDNIIKNMSLKELETVIAHEAGHYKHKHMWQNLALGTVFQLILFLIISLVLKRISPDYLDSQLQILEMLPVFLLMFSVLSTFFLAPLQNAISRRFEYQADQYALESTKDPQAFISAMAGLANRNLSNAYPSGINRFLYYSHPPIGERIAHGETFLQKESHE